MRRVVCLIAAALFAVPLAACSGSDSTNGSGNVTLNYWLWDSAQQPQYQQCADDFTKANPNIKIKITQYGWSDYWNALTTSFVSDTAPDVFVSHLSYYPQFAQRNQLLALDDYIGKDKLDLNVYQPGLADLWKSKDGKQYGLPKDFDTVAIFYNTAKLREAGITAEQMQNLTWNPTDGGSYEKIIARLTVDAKGRHGDEPGFDKNHVVTYGLGLNGSGGAFGQTEWSEYAFSTGWQHAQGPWATAFNFNDQRFKDTIAWWRSLTEKGYMPGLEKVGPGGKSVVAQMDAYGAGKYAMVTEGSWNTKSYWALKGVKSGIAPTPIGPSGKRASMINGLADNIAAGTKHPEAAWQWVKYLASADCQLNIVAKEGIVFPAMVQAATPAKDAFARSGIDVGPFLIHPQDKTTHLAPIADHWTDIQAAMTEAMESYLLFKTDISAIDKANDKINALFR
ncbi:sugar ABC transporter substrate-binding protein [Micromonospora sp. B11E3]|uniref:ABC transporter substrate-binding protein n=1 Tax=Micromonospora sp. B11E3 TaxID=3153562 RepID=UPI00325D4606